MDQLGNPSQNALAAVSEHAMRVTGGVGTLLSTGVIAVSLTTEYGLPARASEAATVTPGNPELTAQTLVAFAQYHPAYPAAIVVGLYFLLLGE
jgi:hypothetical protein